MKREYLAIAVGSLLILAPSALAQDANGIALGGDIQNIPTFHFTNPFDQYGTKSRNTDIQPSPHDAIYKAARQPLAQVAPVVEPDDSDAPAPVAEAPAPTINPFTIVTRVPLQYRTNANVAPVAAPVTDAAPPQDYVAPSDSPDPGTPSSVSAAPVASALASDPAPCSQCSAALTQAVVASSEPLPDMSMSNQACNNIDERGTEGLKEKGNRREQKMDDILRDMRHRTKDVNDAAPGSVSRLNRKDATVRTNTEENAKCEMVIPGEMSGGFIGLEAEYGAGAYKCRDASNHWEKNYHYIQLKGGNIGFQLGGKMTDRVLFFMNDSAVEKLQNLDQNKNKIKVAARAGIDVGPYGRDASVATGWNLHDDIRSYSDSKGLYVGVSLEGAVIHPDRNMDAVMNGGAVTKHKHNWGFIHWGHRNICEAMSDNQQGNSGQATSDSQEYSVQATQPVQASAAVQVPASEPAAPCSVR